MRTKWFLGGFVLITFLAALLRLYQLGSVPHGMTWDEAAVGYNGYAVLTTRRDEWLEFLPTSFRSFGDYKAPLAIYLNGPFTWALGMELWVVRLPFALSGVVAVAVWMLLLRRLELAGFLPRALKDPWYGPALVLFGGALLAFSPWHLHFTRTGFESGLSLTLVLMGVWAWVELWELVKKKASLSVKNWQLWGWALLGVLSLGLSLYAYHSAKLAVPLLGLVLLGWAWPVIQRHWAAAAKIIGLQALVGGVVALPLLRDTLLGHGAERFNQASIFKDGESTGEVVAHFGNNIAAHLHPLYLAGGFTPSLRHGDGAWGVLFPTTLALVLLAVAFFIYSFWKRNDTGLISGNFKRLVVVSLGWIFAGMFPALIAGEAPHSNRMLLALPGFLLLAVLGFDRLIAWVSGWRWNQTIKGSHGEQNLVLKSVVGTFILIYALCFISYQHHYYTAFAAASADEFKDGYVEVMELAHAYEKGLDDKKEVQTIIVSNRYGQPYIYALFVRRTNPIWYHGGSLIKYQFPDQVTVGDLSRENALVIATTEDEIPIEQADHVIYGSDGQVKFKVYVTE